VLDDSEWMLGDHTRQGCGHEHLGALRWSEQARSIAREILASRGSYNMVDRSDIEKLQKAVRQAEHLETFKLGLRLFAVASGIALTLFTIGSLMFGHSQVSSQCFAGVSVVTHNAVYTQCAPPAMPTPPDIR
jgi:hypothetical protein